MNGNLYRLNATKMTWKAAEAEAIRQGGHLVTIRNQSEQDWLDKQFDPLTRRYIGLTRTKNVWVWASGETVGWTKWCRGFPTSQSGDDYAELTKGCWENDHPSQPYESIIEIGLTSASYSIFGAGCASTTLPPALSATTLPKINTKFTLRVSNLAPFTVGILLFGLSDTTWNSVPLPLDLSFLGMNGCNLLVSWDVQDGPFSAPQTGGMVEMNYPMPNLRCLLGQAFYNQAWVIDAKANAFGVGTSNGGKGVIGY
jgi:hypothetical protein